MPYSVYMIELNKDVLKNQDDSGIIFWETIYGL